jgi:EamA domain-containing membrane protein RarD
MVFLNQYSFAQLLVFLVVSAAFQIMMIIGKPMTNIWDHRLTWMIEASISIYLYVLLTLTDFSDQNTLREEKGWTLTILLATVVAINVLIFFWQCFWRAVAYAKRRFGHLFT